MRRVIKKEESKEEQASRDRQEMELYDSATEELKSRVKRLDILFKKKKRLLSKGYEMIDFKEPVLFLIRRDFSVEFYEDVKPGSFKINHSDKDIGEIELKLGPNRMLRFDYGTKQFRGYIYYEDSFGAVPEEPVVAGEEISILIDKTLSDVKKWKAEQNRAFGDMMLKVFMGIGLVIAAIAMYKLLVPPPQSVVLIQNISRNIPPVDVIVGNFT